MSSRRGLSPWVYDVLLVYVLLAGLFLRFMGANWGEYQYLHPDERFLVWVGADISPVQNLSEYFDTANSTLNPHNRGHGFYVYGTLPMFLVRYVTEWTQDQAGWQEVIDVGRSLSALADVLTVWLVYLVGGASTTGAWGCWRRHFRPSPCCRSSRRTSSPWRPSSTCS